MEPDQNTSTINRHYNIENQGKLNTVYKIIKKLLLVAKMMVIIKSKFPNITYKSKAERKAGKREERKKNKTTQNSYSPHH